MYRLLNFITVLLASVTSALAQGETNIWYFGTLAGVDFNSGTPIALTNGALNTSEGCATIADRNGNLIFYTDGIKVWTRLHTQMPNGFGLLGDPSSAQSAIIVPRPGYPDLYYIFTVDDGGGPNGLRYSVVDLTLNGGLGDVVAVSKNTLLFTPSVEKVTAVKHANGIDVWVLSHGLNNNRYYAYLVTCKGVNAPITSDVGSVEGWPGWGYLVASPNGQRLASAMRSVGFEVLDFNHATGVVSNPILLGHGGNCYGISFSPNNNVLYGLTIVGGQILQWNLQAGTPAAIIASAYNVGTAYGTGAPYRGGAMQLGPDGKLYICQFRQPYLSVINNPDVLGAGCNLQFNAVNLSGRDAVLGLPPFIQSYFDTTAVIQSSGNCTGHPVNFSISGNTTYLDSVKWNFDDPGSGPQNISASLTPSHVFSSSGIYNIQLIRYLGCVADTSYKVLSIVGPYPYTNNVSICPGTSYTLPGGNIITSPGVYTDTVAALNTCDSIVTTNLIFGNPNIIISSDTAVCLGSTVQLNVSGGLFSYSWSPAATLNDSAIQNPIATPQQTTTYFVRTTTSSGELIANGDFTSGNSGFSSSYTHTSNLLPAATYFIGSDPSLYNSGFNACSDHTNGSGNMMIINGAGNPGVTIWCQSVNVIPNTDFAFSCWLGSLNSVSPAVLQFSINGTLIGAPFSASPIPCNWQQFYATWNSGSNSTANICIVNQNTAAGGNDFVIDDISFTGFCDATDSVTVTVIDPKYNTIDTSVCEGSVYTFPDGTTSSVTSSNSSTVLSHQGCDSIITTNLFVIPSDSTTIIDTICSGSYTLPDGSAVNSTGVYEVVIPNHLGCDSAVMTVLTVLNLSAVSLPNHVSCFGDSNGSVTVTTSGGLAPLAFELNLSGNLIASNQSGVFGNLAAGTYSVIVTDDYGCADSNGVIITQPLLFSSTPAATSISCFGLNDGAIAFGPAGGTPAYTISITGQPSNSSGIFTGLSPGTYDYLIEDANGCIDSGTVVISEPPAIVIQILPDTLEMNLGETLQLNASSNYDPDASYLWTPAEGLSCTNCPDPLTTALNSIVYQLQVSTNTNGNSCIHSVNVPITVFASHDIFIPNAFTPNADRTNDYFEIYGSLLAIKNFQVLIFNRLGEKVFEDNDAHFKWDGTYRGKLLNPDVFAYSIQTTYLDNFPPKQFKGSVTLIR